MKNENSFEQRQKALTEPIVIMLLLTLLFFAPSFPHFRQNVLSSESGDVALSFYYLREFGFSQLRSGVVPLWNPHLYSGTSFIGDLQSAIFYPLNFMFLVLRVGEAINVNLMLHTFLAGLFFYLFMRELGLRKFASVLAGVTFMFSTATLNRVVAGHLADIDVLVWLPVVFLVFVRMERDRGVGWVAVGALAFGCMILAGHPQFVFYFCIYLGLYVAYRVARFLWAGDWAGAGRYGLMVIAVMAGGVLLSAIHLFPAIEFGRDSFRAQMTNYKFCSVFSFPPENLLTFIFPGFFGTSYTENYWGRCYAWEMVAYIGILPLAFALAGLFVSRRRERFFFVGAAVVTTILALGSNTPLFKLLYAYVPGFNLFRGNSKFIVATVFSLSVLAGIGFEGVLEERLERRELRRLRGVVIGVLVFAGICVLLSVLLSIGAEREDSAWADLLLYRASLHEFYVESPDFGAKAVRQELWRETSGDLRKGIALLVVSGFILYLAGRKAEKRKMIKMLVAVGVVANLGSFWEQQMVRFNKDSILLGREIASVFEGDRLPHRLSASRGLEGLNFGMMYNVSTIFGNLSNHLSRYHDFMTPAREGEAKAWALVLQPPLDSPLYRMLDVRYYLVGEKEKIGVEGARLAAESGGLALYRREDVMPRAYFVQRMIPAYSREEAYKRIASGDFSPEEETVVEVGKGFREDEFSGAVTTGTAEIVKWNVNGETIRAKSLGKGILVVSEIYDRGWKCFVDGKRGAIYPANYILLGIPLDKGEHTVMLRYLPDGYVVGKNVTFAAVFIVIVTAAIGVDIRGKRKRDSR